MKNEVLARRNRIITAVFLVVAVLFALCSNITNFNIVKGMTSVPIAVAWMFKNFIPDVSSLSKIPDILDKLIETILLSIAATTIASVFALFFGVMGSKATRVNNFLSTFSRFIASAFRNIPDAVWAMIFLLSFGQNILTGYFALFFVSFGILTRAFIETIDESGIGVIEALEATGASYFQIIFQAVIPSAMSQMISWILYMIETNIRSSTLIGILTGTGIGFIFDLYYKSMKYNVAGLVILSIVLLVFTIEFISNRVRREIL